MTIKRDIKVLRNLEKKNKQKNNYEEFPTESVQLT